MNYLSVHDELAEARKQIAALEQEAADWKLAFQTSNEHVGKLEAERDEARQFGEDAAKKYNALLKTASVVTCAFCGAEYPRGTPRHGDGALAEHIKICPSHPMRTLEAERDQLKAWVGALEDDMNPQDVSDLRARFDAALSRVTP